MLGHLVSLGLSRAFVECARDFVDGKSIKQYLPTPEEDEMIKRFKEKQEQDAA